MNENIFNQICKSDLDNLNQLISKGYFEVSDFIEAASRLEISLRFFNQTIGVNE